MENKCLTLRELLNRIATLVHQPETQNIWITAELQDVQVKGGHCYLELLQKDDGGQQLARIRGNCWANTFRPMAQQFKQVTGQEFASGLKVMIRVSASMHPVFGLALVIHAINPAFTMGDLLRRRQEILNRLHTEGVLEMNRQLKWPTVVQRIAIISAAGAAGYGDFMNQLYHNPAHLKFHTRLFPAVMQGNNTAPSIVAALEQIAKEAHLWDGVVIIRGGGATSDLQGFEDYTLAAAVAQFPLPIAIGIGHERDITVLDYVANLRLKTPTAVAEWLISKGENLLGALINAGNKILQYATQKISGNKEQLAQAEALIPVASRGVIERQRSRLNSALASIAGLSGSRIKPTLARLDMMGSNIATLTSNQLRRQADLLDAKEKLLEVLSPAATLARGYSITRIDGHAVSSVKDVPLGAQLEITMADGSFLAHTP